MPEGVTIDRDGPIAVVTIRNPTRRNALSDGVKAELLGAFDTLYADGRCRAIVLTGAEGTFSSGGSIDTMAAMNALEGRERVAKGQPLVRRMIAGDKPIVAAVEGFAFGAGFSLALACDHIVAARDAQFCASFGRIGLMPDLGMIWSLPQRVGHARAKRLMMLAETVGAEDGHRVGLVDTLAEPGQALAAATGTARAFAAAAPLPNRLTKAALASWPRPLDRMLAHEAQGQGLLFVTEDVQEGLKAFFEKRAPDFQGR